MIDIKARAKALYGRLTALWRPRLNRLTHYVGHQRASPRSWAEYDHMAKELDAKVKRMRQIADQVHEEMQTWLSLESLRLIAEIGPKKEKR